MAKKKGKKKQSGTKLLVSSVVVLALLVVGIIGGSAAYRYSNSYIITVNGEKVASSEYLFNLYYIKTYLEYSSGSSDIWDEVDDDGVTYAEMAYEYALNQVLSLEACAQKAEEMGFTITDDDADAVQTWVDDLTSSYSTYFTYVGMTDDELERMAEKYVLYDKLYEEVVADYEMDEEAAQESYATYLTDSRSDYLTVYVDYIRVDDDETAHTVLSKLKDGEDVEELCAEYSNDYLSAEDQKAEAIAAAEETEGDEETIAAAVAEAEEAEYVNYGDITSGEFSDEIIAAAFDNMEVGDISSIYEDDDGTYVIFVIHDIIEPDYDDLEEWFMSDLLSNEQSTYFSGLLEEWVSALDYKLNTRLYNSIDVDNM